MASVVYNGILPERTVVCDVEWVTPEVNSAVGAGLIVEVECESSGRVCCAVVLLQLLHDGRAHRSTYERGVLQNCRGGAAA